MTSFIKRLAAVSATAAMILAGLTGIAAPAQAATLAPTVPTALSVASGVKSLTASWTAPAVVGDNAATGYRIQYSTSSTFPATSTTTVPLNTTDTSYTITGLADKTTYYVKVAATNSAGTSPNTLGVSKATWGVAAAPSSVKAIAGLQSATVNWAPPTVAGAPITGYTVQYSKDSTFATGVTTLNAGTALSLQITGLADATPYFFRVAALNEIGTGAWSAAVPMSTFNVPGAPTSLKITGGASKATLTWVAPTSNGGAPITGYRIQYSTDATFATQNILEVGAVTSAVISNLPSNVAYYARIAAVNDVGFSAYSATATGTTLNVPSMPVISAVTSGLNQLTARWTAPTSGAAITGYEVRYSTDPAFPDNNTAATLVASNVTTAVLPNLTSGTTYYVQVAAISAVGSGAFSTSVSGTTFSAPAVPTSLTATGNLGSALLNWVAPTNTGGSPVTSYKIQYSTDSTFATGVTTLDSGKSSVGMNVLGLANGTTYFFRVATVTGAGTSEYTTSTVSAATFGAPAPPTSLKATAGAGLINASWVTPTSTGGSIITGYTIKYSTDPTFATNSSLFSAKASPALIPGIEAGKTYYLQVTATSAAGTSVPSNTATATTYSAPSAPGAVTATTGTAYGSISVKWAAPTNTGGAPISGYAIQYSTESNFSSSSTVNLTGTSTSATITGLPNGTTYYVRVAAKTAAGTSVYADAAAPASTLTATASPSGVTITRGMGSLTANWTAPTSSSATITGYTVLLSTNSSMSGAVSKTVTGAANTTATFTGLISGTTYYMTVAATTNLGVTSYSPKTSASPFHQFAAPTDYVVTATDDNGFVATWSPVVDVNVPTITSYQLQYSKDATFATGVTTVNLAADDTTYTATGLTAGSTYSVRVAAVSSFGASPNKSTTTVYASAHPAAVSSVAATAVDLTTANVSWTAGAANGMPITSYTVTATPSTGVSISYPVDRTQTGATASGLTPGVDYVFTVVATNSNGDSASASNAPFSTAAPADAPATPTVTVGSISSLATSWTAPATHGAAIDGYKVQYSTDPAFTSAVTTVNVSGTSYTITGLTAGTRYYVRVAADSVAGLSAYSTGASNIPGAAPAAPSNVTATNSGLTGANITWTAPNANGYALTAYTVTVTPSAGVSIQQSGITASATATGLTAGTTYTFTVKATNARGTSASSASSSITTPAVADAPSNLAVETGTRQITPTWTTPANNGAAITGYTLQYSTSPTFASNVVTVANAVSGDTITGLVNNTTYYVRVAAVNAVGTGANSTIASALTNAISSAPTDAAMTLTGVTGSTEPRSSSADLTWTAPANDGRTPVTSYTVTVSPAAGVTVSYPTDRTQTGASISGMTAGTTYTFTVKATNAAGTSAASTASVPVTAPDVATAPTNVTTTVTGTTSADVTWTAPGLDNGAEITDYIVTATPSAGLTISHSGAETVAHVSGLTNGTAYVFTVKAVNAVGKSAAASSDSNLIATAPEAPAAPTLEIASATELTATWNVPEANGSPITGYTLQYSTDSTFTTGVTTVTNANRGGTLSGLTTGSTYYVRVKAGNDVGFSSYSVAASLIPGSAPAAVAKPSASLTGLTTASVTWTAPAANGYAITGYTVTATPSAGLTITNTGTATTATVTGMTAGTTYTFTVKATNALGTSIESASSTAITTADLPNAPAAPAVTATGLTTTDLSVSAPANNGSAITGYTYQVSTDSTFTTGVTTLNGGATIQATGLTNGSTYYFRAAAINGVGRGAWSPSTSNLVATVPATVSAPTVAVASATSVTATWNAPAANGSPITSYTLQYTTDPMFTSGVTTVTNATSGMTLSGLTTGTRYYVHVKANNIVGSGTYGAAGSQIPGAVPSAPAAPSATLTGLTTASLSWTAPAANGYAITGYTVTATPSAGVTITNTGTATTATVSGMAAGTSYTFAVTATNALGTSAPSSDISASNVITTPDVTNAPTGVAASVTGLTTATVTWNAPTNINGSAITGYVVTATPSTGVTITNTGTATSASVTGLTNGTSYVFAVRAVNGVGNSAAGSSASTLIATAPAAPATPSVAVTSISSLTPTWTAPAANGSPITSYTMQYSTDSTFATGVTTVSNATSGSAITGLTTGTAYYFRVKAINAIGESDYSTAGSQIPGAAPAAPTGLTVSVAAATSLATASWTAPAANGYAITGYTLQYSTDSTFATGVTNQSVVAPTVTATTVALTKGATYYFRVLAINSIGTSAAATAVNALVPAAPATPAAPTASISGTTATVTWTAPANGGSAITGYTVVATPSAGVTITNPGVSTSTTASGLTAGTAYTFTVVATNVVGSSATSASSATVITAPTTPTGIGTNGAGAANGTNVNRIFWNAVTCSAGFTPTYAVVQNTGGTNSASGITNTYYDIPTAWQQQGKTFGYAVSAQCVGSVTSAASGTATTSFTTTVNTPAAPVVTTTGNPFYWSAVSCPAGTSAQYQAYQDLNDSSWVTYLVMDWSTSTGSGLRTAYPGYQERSYAVARCVGPNAVSATSAAGYSGQWTVGVPAPYGVDMNLIAYRTMGWWGSCSYGYIIFNVTISAAWGSWNSGWTTGTSYARTGNAWGTFSGSGTGVCVSNGVWSGGVGMGY